MCRASGASRWLVVVILNPALTLTVGTEVRGESLTRGALASTTAEVNAAGTFRIGGGNNTVGITLDGSSLAGDKIGSDAGIEGIIVAS